MVELMSMFEIYVIRINNGGMGEIRGGVDFVDPIRLKWIRKTAKCADHKRRQSKRDRDVIEKMDINTSSIICRNLLDRSVGWIFELLSLGG